MLLYSTILPLTYALADAGFQRSRKAFSVGIATSATPLLRAMDASTYVPGHGPLADAMALDRYIDLLGDLEAAARRAIDRGISSEQAGEEYRIPDGLGDWYAFQPTYFATAIGAWMSELEE